MFRSFADVVLPDDLKDYVKVPVVAAGQRQIITAEATAAFKAYQRLLDERIKAIEERDRAPEPGDDILAPHARRHRERPQVIGRAADRRGFHEGRDGCDLDAGRLAEFVNGGAKVVLAVPKVCS